MWLIGVWLSECKGQEEKVLGCRIFTKACDLGNVGMIVWVVILLLFCLLPASNAFVQLFCL